MSVPIEYGTDLDYAIAKACGYKNILRPAGGDILVVDKKGYGRKFMPSGNLNHAFKAARKCGLFGPHWLLEKRKDCWAYVNRKEGTWMNRAVIEGETIALCLCAAILKLRLQ